MDHEAPADIQQATLAQEWRRVDSAGHRRRVDVAEVLKGHLEAIGWNPDVESVTWTLLKGWLITLVQ